jgi:hypothetical protein
VGSQNVMGYFVVARLFRITDAHSGTTRSVDRQSYMYNQLN